MNKPPIAIPSLGIPTDVYNGMLRQRDKDVKHYESLIKEMYEALGLVKRWLDNPEIRIEEITPAILKTLDKAEGKDNPHMT